MKKHFIYTPQNNPEGRGETGRGLQHLSDYVSVGETVMYWHDGEPKTGIVTSHLGISLVINSEIVVTRIV